jgi:hypothetical protein
MNDESRRKFLGFFSGAGLGGTLLPGVLWAQIQQDSAQKVTQPMLADALQLSGLTFAEDDQKAMLEAVNRQLTQYEDLRKIHIPNDVAPPFYFSPITPGMKVNRARMPIHFSAPKVKRPANLEDVAFWPITQLAQLIRTKQVKSVELTEMYLKRLHRYNDKLNCVVTFLDELAWHRPNKRIQRSRRASTKARCTEFRGARKTLSLLRAIKPPGAQALTRNR